jgi:hypothetical protein
MHNIRICLKLYEIFQFYNPIIEYILLRDNLS